MLSTQKRLPSASSNKAFAVAGKGLTLAGTLAAGLFAAAFWSPHEARAEFRVCNDTANLVGVAVGYRAEEGWISEGWWQLPATTCATVDCFWPMAT